MEKYEVVVGNVGTVYSGGFYDSALDAFTIYKSKSLNDYGRAAGEDVTMLKNGEIFREYIGSIAESQIDD
jgi:hypothetical protein